MTERPDPDQFEEELRQALQSGSETVDGSNDDDDLLRRVHRGAARRRVRRRAGAFFATAATVAAIAVSVPFLSQGPPADRPTSEPALQTTPTRTGDQTAVEDRRPRGREYVSPPTSRGHGHQGSAAVSAPPLRTGEPVEVKDVLVRSVTGTRNGYWLSASAECEGRSCSVLGHTDGGEMTFTSTKALASPVAETTVRFSGDDTTGWLTSGDDTWGTTDGGQRWERLRQPADLEVENLEAWGDDAWAAGQLAGRPVVLNEAADAARFHEVTPPGELALEPELGVTLGEDAYGLPVDGAESFVYTTDDGGQWEQSEIGCEPTSLSATLDAVWAFCNESTPTLVRSFDQGRTWDSPMQMVDLALPDESARVAAISDTAAFVTSGSQGWVVEDSVASPVSGLGDGPYVYAGFTSESVGFVLDTDGSLCRTEDGGRNWFTVDLP